jgi:arsenate reductase (thioredoxin)
MQKKTILFICTGNAGRSQMAEAMFRNQYGDKFEIVSAGVEPWNDLHPMAVKLMAEDGIDMANHYPQHVQEYLNDEIDIAVTIGDRAEAETGDFKTGTLKIHWPINDPADADGTPDSEKVFRWTRQAIIDSFPKLLELASNLTVSL